MPRLDAKMLFHMLRTALFSVLAFILWVKPSSAQQSNLQDMVPEIESAATLSQTLLAFSDNSKINVVADTTRNGRDPDADLITVWPKAQRIAWMLNKQSLVFGYYWNQPDESTVLIWPKPDSKALARAVVQKWDEQYPRNPLSAEITRYLNATAQKLDAGDNEESRLKDKIAQFQFSELSPEERDLLTPLVRSAQRNRAAKYDREWLEDDFWDRVVVGNVRFNDRNMWMLGAPASAQKPESSGLGLVPQKVRAPSVWTDTSALVSPEANAQIGARFEGELPAALKTPLPFKAENLPVAQVLEHLSALCGVPLVLDAKAAEAVREKRLTIIETGLAPSALLRDVALLYDLTWKSEGEKVTASINPDAFQNTAAKIGSLPSLYSWGEQRQVTQPDFDSLIGQEVSLAQARKKGVSFKTLSPELQAALRAYNENFQSYDILMTWQRTLQPLPRRVTLSFLLHNAMQRRNATPLPDPPPTPEELRDPQIQAEYNATFYERIRPFMVTVISENFSVDYPFSDGISLKEPPKEAPLPPA